MSIYERRLGILRRVERGELSVTDGAELLAGLEDGGDEVIEAAPSAAAPAYRRWEGWWLLPFGLGVVLIALGAWWMYNGYAAAGLSWGFWLSWLPFGLGVLLAAFAWQSRLAPWLHVRVHQRPDEKPEWIVISMPLPLGLAAWGLRTFGGFLPKEVRDQPLDELLLSLSQTIHQGDPLHVQVDDEDGSQVEVYIG